MAMALQKGPQAAANRSGSNSDAAGDDNQPAEALSPAQMGYGSEVFGSRAGLRQRRFVLGGQITDFTEPCANAISRDVAKNAGGEEGDRRNDNRIEPLTQSQQCADGGDHAQ
jgi:hypothetical protein